MNQLKDFIDDLATACVDDDCGYDPLPQHIAHFTSLIRDSKEHQARLAEHLANLEIVVCGAKYSLWVILAPEALRTDDLSGAAMVETIRREASAWAAVELSYAVDAAIDAKMGGWIPDEVEFVDEFGGAIT